MEKNENQEEVFNGVEIFNDKIDDMTVEDALHKYERMVYSLVRGAKTNTVCTREDLVQEGLMAIVIAFRNYDESKGASLGTWTYKMVRSSIQEYQKQHLSILSGGAYLQNVLRKAGAETVDGDEEISVEELMQYGVSKGTALAAPMLRASCSHANLDDLAPMLRDESQDINVCSLDWRSYLNEEEQYIIAALYGFDGEERATMQEIGDKLGRSRKSVSYVKNKALQKLRRIPGIEEFYFN